MTIDEFVTKLCEIITTTSAVMVLDLAVGGFVALVWIIVTLLKTYK